MCAKIKITQILLIVFSVKLCHVQCHALFQSLISLLIYLRFVWGLSIYVHLTFTNRYLAGMAVKDKSAKSLIVLWDTNPVA